MKIKKVFKRLFKNPRSIVGYIYAMGLLNFLSDKSVLKILYWVNTGSKLNLKNPKSFNEKIQWLKLYNRNKKMTMMVDKYRVREYIKNLIGEEYVIPLLKVYDNEKEIDFNKLPDEFVLKCNHNAAIGLCVCRDKSKLDIKKVRANLRKGLNKNFYYSSREWAYKNVERKIICEKYMEDVGGKPLRDYKFFCFNGKAEFVYLSEGLEKHDTASISFYDLNGNKMPFHRSDYKEFDETPEFPSNFEQMKEIANKIARDINIPFVRIDLYSIKGKVYFSEITFYPNSGFTPFEPKEWDLKIGELIDLKLQ